MVPLKEWIMTTLSFLVILQDPPAPVPKKAVSSWTKDPFIADGLGSRDVSSSVLAGFSVFSDVLISIFIEFSTVDAAGLHIHDCTFTSWYIASLGLKRMSKKSQKIKNPGRNFLFPASLQLVGI